MSSVPATARTIARAHSYDALTARLAGRGYLPAYAPDLNPVEGLWANLKAVELAGLAAALEELQSIVHRGIDRIRAAWYLPDSFLRHCGLSL